MYEGRCPPQKKRFYSPERPSTLLCAFLKSLIPSTPTAKQTSFTQTQEAERMIEKMEQDEDVLIERLKKVQDEQRKAYELLQESLES